MGLRILSIDGGGIRGIVPATWLKWLEEHLKGGLHGSFDVFAGTSTGSLLAAGLASGRAKPGHLLELYTNRAGAIFKRRSRFLHGLIPCPRYTGAGLEDVLGKCLEDLTMRDVADKSKRLIICSIDGCTRRPVCFDSADPQHHNLRIVDACRASSAAPTYFSPHTISLGGIKLPYVDGGLAANNPAALTVALTQSPHSHPRDSIVVSLGTGEIEDNSTDTMRVAGKLSRAGFLGWATLGIGIAMDSTSSASDQIVRQLVGDNYFRFQVPIATELSSIDATDANVLRRLSEAAQIYWSRPDIATKVSALLRLLNPVASADLSGIWKSNPRWCSAYDVGDIVSRRQYNFNKNDGAENERVEIRQIGSSITGNTVRGSTKWPFEFRGSLLSSLDLIGEHWGPTGLRGTFVIRFNRENHFRQGAGFWSGQGDHGIYAGTWALSRLAPEGESHAGPQNLVV